MPAKTDRDATRPYRVLFVLFALALAGRITYTIDAIGDMRHRIPGPAGDARQPLAFHCGGSTIMPAPAGLQVGDRVIRDRTGRAQEGLRRSLHSEVRRKNPCE